MNAIAKLWLIFTLGTSAAYGATVLFRHFEHTHPLVVAAFVVATIIATIVYEPRSWRNL